MLEVAAPPVESTPEAAAPEPVDVVAEPVTPEQPTLFGEQVTEPDLPWDPDSTQDFDWTAVEHAEAVPVDDEAVVEAARAAQRPTVPRQVPSQSRGRSRATTSADDHGPVDPGARRVQAAGVVPAPARHPLRRRRRAGSGRDLLGGLAGRASPRSASRSA